MTVSIELLLDLQTEAYVRADWAALESAGHSNLGAHRAPSNRPHITLLVRPTLELIAFASVVAELPFEIALGEPIVFDHGERIVLARPVVLDETLARVHRAAHDAVPAGEDAPHTVPGEWTPHVTLARRLRRESLDDALALLGAPRRGFAVSLRRWDSETKTVTDLG